jgi:hypothetical protein
MECAKENLVDQTELADEALEQAAGGWWLQRWFYKQGTGGGDTGTNTVWFTTTVT